MNRILYRKWTPPRVDREGRPIVTPAVARPGRCGDAASALRGGPAPHTAAREPRMTVGLFRAQVFVAEVLRFAPAGSPDLLLDRTKVTLPEIGAVIILETAAEAPVVLGEALTVQALHWNWALAVELTHRQPAGERAVYFGNFLGARLRLG